MGRCEMVACTNGMGWEVHKRQVELWRLASPRTFIAVFTIAPADPRLERHVSKQQSRIRHPKTSQTPANGHNRPGLRARDRAPSIAQEKASSSLSSPSTFTPFPSSSPSSSASAFFFDGFLARGFFVGLSSSSSPAPSSSSTFFLRLLAGVFFGVALVGVLAPSAAGAPPAMACAASFFLILAQALEAETGLAKPARPASLP